MNSLIIIGAGGHGKQCIEIAELMGYTNIKIFDDYKEGNLLGYNIIKEIENNSDCFIAIGDNNIRKKFHERYKNMNFVNLIHPKANVSKYAIVGVGNYIGCQTIIMQDVNIGSFNIINDMSCVAHDCTIGDYNHLSIFSFMAGNSHIGNYNFICGHAMILPEKTIGNFNTLGANSTLLKSCEDGNILVGTPAKNK